MLYLLKGQIAKNFNFNLKKRTGNPSVESERIDGFSNGQLL